MSVFSRFDEICAQKIGQVVNAGGKVISSQASYWFPICKRLMLVPNNMSAVVFERRFGDYRPGKQGEGQTAQLAELKAGGFPDLDFLDPKHSSNKAILLAVDGNGIPCLKDTANPQHNALTVLSDFKSFDAVDRTSYGRAHLFALKATEMNRASKTHGNGGGGQDSAIMEMTALVKQIGGTIFLLDGKEVVVHIVIDGAPNRKKLALCKAAIVGTNVTVTTSADLCQAILNPANQ
jgi:hypothetical protein